MMESAKNGKILTQKLGWFFQIVDVNLYKAKIVIRKRKNALHNRANPHNLSPQRAKGEKTCFHEA